MKFSGLNGQVLRTAVLDGGSVRICVGSQHGEGLTMVVHKENAAALKNWLVANLPEAAVENASDLNTKKAPLVDGVPTGQDDDLNAGTANNGESPVTDAVNDANDDDKDPVTDPVTDPDPEDDAALDPVTAADGVDNKNQGESSESGSQPTV